MHKLGIIVPYRNRDRQLLIFKKAISSYLSDKDINYELIVVEQDDAKTFNRGKLLNIGFLQAKKLKCDYVVFHDVDMLPIDVDYSYYDKPLHLATNFTLESLIPQKLFILSNMNKKEDWRKIPIKKEKDIGYNYDLVAITKSINAKFINIFHTIMYKFQKVKIEERLESI